jgi:trigger factor
VTIKTVETESEGLKRAFMLTIPAKDIDARVDKEVKRLAPQVRMPGFRPGKVPPNLIRKMHGEALQRDALSGAVQEGVQKLLEEKKLRPAMQPEVELEERYQPGKDAEIRVRLEALPRSPDPDISGLKLERLVVEPDEKGGRRADRPAAADRTRAGRTRPRAARPNTATSWSWTSRARSTARPSRAARARTCRSRSARAGSSRLRGSARRRQGRRHREVKVTFPGDYPVDNRSRARRPCSK